MAEAIQDPGLPRRANIIGVGLIGGSVALGLRDQGWVVYGEDRDPAVDQLAIELGVIDEIGFHPDAEVTFVATPVGGVVEAVERALADSTGIVTDVGSVKTAIARSISHPRFVAGHPMAGSEQDGVTGARLGLFNNANVGADADRGDQRCGVYDRAPGGQTSRCRGRFDGTRDTR